MKAWIYNRRVAKKNILVSFSFFFFWRREKFYCLNGKLRGTYLNKTFPRERNYYSPRNKISAREMRRCCFLAIPENAKFDGIQMRWVRTSNKTIWKTLGYGLRKLGREFDENKHKQLKMSFLMLNLIKNKGM